VSVSTSLDTGWRRIPVLVAEIPGNRVPDEFVLLHGHLDSWHVGVGDNATGDATMLELARVFWQHRDDLTRTVRIAWWSGHSHGRYAGSTWYADTFGIEYADAGISIEPSRPALVGNERWSCARCIRLGRHIFQGVVYQADTASRTLSGRCAIGGYGHVPPPLNVLR